MKDNKRGKVRTTVPGLGFGFGYYRNTRAQEHPGPGIELRM